MKAIAIENDKTKNFLNDRYIWLLLIISLSVRIYLSFFTYVIKNDSVAFMQNAEYFASGDFASALGHDYHPLYSLFMAVLYKIVPNLELSGTIISVLFGTLTVIVFYLIGKNIFDRKISFVSSIILAFHPYAVRFSADIISESTYFFFFISASGLGYFAITNRKLFLFVLAGMCSALAYLTRPEGIGVIIIVAFWCALKDCTKIRALWKEKLAAILVLIISFLVFSMPYLVFIKKETGSWSLTKKKEVSYLSGVTQVINTLKRDEGSDKLEHPIIKETSARKSGLGIHLKGLLHLVKKYISTFHPLLFIFFIIGVINWTRINKERIFGLYVITVIVFYLLVLYRLSVTHLANDHDTLVYPSRRHLMPLVIPAVFYVGSGVYTAGAWIHEKFHNCNFIVGFKELLKSTWIVQLIVLMIVVSVLLPKTLKPQRFDKRGIKVVGQWIREHAQKPSPVILSDSARNAYYAGGMHEIMGPIEEAIELGQIKRVDYMLITYREYVAIEKPLQQSIKDKKLVLAYEYPEETPFNKRSVFLYRFLH